MMSKLNKPSVKKELIIGIFTVMLLFFSHGFVKGQEMPPRPISAFSVQNIRFGAFCTGANGGDVTVSHNGSRSATFDIILVNMGYIYSQAIFEIDGEKGTIIHILPIPDVQLSGDNGGTMTAYLDDFFPGDPIILYTQPPARTQVFLGGRLEVKNLLVNPVGNYSGIFMVTFIQE
jgi:hypothetical protein